MNRKLTLIAVLLTGLLIVLGVAVGVQLRHEAARSAIEAQIEKKEATVKAAQQKATAREMPLYNKGEGGVTYVAPLGKVPEEFSRPTPEKVR